MLLASSDIMEPQTRLHFGPSHFTINRSPRQNFGSNKGEEENAADTRNPEANNPATAAAEHGKNSADRSLVSEVAPGIVFEEGPLPPAENPSRPLEPHTRLNFGPSHLTIINNFPPQNFGSNRGEEKNAAGTRGPEANNPASAAAEHGKNDADRSLDSEGVPGIVLEVPYASFNFGAHHFKIISTPRQNFVSNRGKEENAADSRGAEENNPASAAAENGKNDADPGLVTDGAPHKVLEEEPLSGEEHPGRPLVPYASFNFGAHHFTINSSPRQKFGSNRGEEEHAADTRCPEADNPASAAEENRKNGADRGLVTDRAPGIVVEEESPRRPLAPHASFNFGAHYFTINSSPRQNFGSNRGVEEHAADTRDPEVDNPASAATEHGKNDADRGLVTDGNPAIVFKEPHTRLHFGPSHLTIINNFPRQYFASNRGEEENAADTRGPETNNLGSAAAEHGKDDADRSLEAEGAPGIVFEAPHVSYNFGAHHFTINSSPRQNFGSNRGVEEHAADTRCPEADKPASAAEENRKNDADRGLVTDGNPAIVFKEPNTGLYFGPSHLIIRNNFPRQIVGSNKEEEEHAADSRGAEAENIFNG